MDDLTPVKSEFIRRDTIIGSRRFSNYFWAFVVFFASLGFLIVGISSYFHYDLVFFLSSAEISFFPQGLVMSFYGISGLFLSLYLSLTIFWSVGGGYNEFNKKEGVFRLFRWGFPGQNRRILLTYPLSDIEAIRIEIKEGINPTRTIYLRLLGKKTLPLTPIGQPMTLLEIEEQAAELAAFLQVSLEGI